MPKARQQIGSSSCLYALTLLVFGIVIGLAHADTLKQRLAVSPQNEYIRQLSAEGSQALSKLTDRSEKLQRMLSLDEFIAVLSANDIHIHSHDYKVIWFLFQECQSPKLSPLELSSICRSVRSAIVTFDSAYTYTVFEGNSVKEKLSCDFCIDGSKIYYRDRNEKGATKVESYDGKVLRSCEFTENPVKGNGSIQLLNGRAHFFAAGNPLTVTMIASKQQDLGGGGLYDRELATIVTETNLYDQPATFEGTPCVLFGSPGFQYFLDPAKSYTLRGVLYSKFEFNDDAGRIIENEKYSGVRCTDAKNMGHGIWFPHSIEQVTYVSKLPFYRELTNIERLTINQPIDPSRFENVFPNGVIVANSLKHTVYTVGKDRSIAATVDPVIQEKVSSSRRWLIALNLAAVLVILFLIIRRRIFAT